jgi:RAB6A-GEF complex partner protein 2
MAATSNIRASVQWKQPTVFAGEEIECIITFKNVAPTQNGNAIGQAAAGRRLQAQKAITTQPNPAAPRSRKNSLRSQAGVPVAPVGGPPLSRQSSLRSRGGPPTVRGHRPTLSLSTSQTAPPLSHVPSSGAGSSGVPPKTRHGRSVSIVSMGTPVQGGDKMGHNVNRAASGPAKGHTRSTSLNMVPRRSGAASAPPSGN